MSLYVYLFLGLLCAAPTCGGVGQPLELTLKANFSQKSCWNITQDRNLRPNTPRINPGNFGGRLNTLNIQFASHISTLLIAPTHAASFEQDECVSAMKFIGERKKMGERIKNLWIQAASHQTRLSRGWHAERCKEKKNEIKACQSERIALSPLLKMNSGAH